MIYDGYFLYTLNRYEYLVNKKRVYGSIIFRYDMSKQKQKIQLSINCRKLSMINTNVFIKIFLISAFI